MFQGFPSAFEDCLLSLANPWNLPESLILLVPAEWRNCRWKVKLSENPNAFDETC